MSDPLIFVITTAGRAALVNAQNTGTGAVTISQIGVSATAVAANAGMTALPGELKRLATFGGSGVADDTIHVTLRDESADVYSLRAFGLYLTDGTLFGLYGQAGVISEKTNASVILLSADIKLADIAAATIEFGSTDFMNPPATETVMGVLSLATNAEASAGTVPNKAITPKTLAFALSAWFTANFSDVWRASNDGAGSGLDAGLLAGQLPAYYTNITARLGYTPANRAGDTFTGAFGRDPQYLMDMSGNNPLLVLDTGDYLLYNRAINQLLFTVGGATQWYAVDGVFYAAAGVNIAGNAAWHAGNDGAGSGLDAGLLAGQAPSYYTNIAARQGYASANKAGEAFTGPIQAPAVTAGAAGNGTAALANGNATNTGYLEFRLANGTRVGYIGYAAGGSVPLIAENGYNFNFLQRPTFNGVAPWDAANDGAGSGLDAGLFAGQTPDWYQQNIYNVRSLEIGQTLAGDGSSFIDMHSSAGVDYSARIVRDAGANGNFSIVQTGSGSVNINGGGTLLRDGNTLWHAGNDGAGSGLDAGLLAGQAPSYYTDIVARIGYTPLNQAYYTASDILAKLVTVDGSGSGNDADMVDGLHGSDLVKKTDIMSDFAAAMSLVWGGAFGPNSFRLGGLLVQTGIVSTLAANGLTAINFPTHFSAPPVVLLQRRTSTAVTNADSGAGIEGTPTVASANIRNTTSGAVIDIIWVAFGPA